MSADVWLKRDIQNVLTAAWESQKAMQCLTLDYQRLEDYLGGFSAALRMVAGCFGISPDVVAERLQLAAANARSSIPQGPGISIIEGEKVP